jgi:hypothetical protein
MTAWLKSSRRVAATMAMASGLVTPATALAHGFAHEREAAAEHHAAHHSEHAFELTGIDHDHPQIDAVPGMRVELSLIAVVVQAASHELEPTSESALEYPLPDEVPRTESVCQTQPLPRSPPFAAN